MPRRVKRKAAVAAKALLTNNKRARVAGNNNQGRQQRVPAVDNLRVRPDINQPQQNNNNRVMGNSNAAGVGNNIVLVDGAKADPLPDGLTPMQVLQEVFIDRDVGQMPTLSPGAELYAMANYVLDNEEKLPLKQVAEPRHEVPEDQLEPTFLNLEDAVMRDSNFKGKLLDAFFQDFSDLFGRYYSRRCTAVYERELCSRLLHQNFPHCRTPLIEHLVDECSGRYAVAAWICFFVESNLSYMVRRFFLHVEQDQWTVMASPLPIPRKRRAHWLPNPEEGPMAESIRDFSSALRRFRADYPQLFEEGTDRLVQAAENISAGEEMVECLVCTSEFPLRLAISCSDPNGGSKNNQVLDLATTPTSSAALNRDSAEIHRFCVECLVGAARAATQEMPLAEGGVGLKCMAGDCDNSILFSDCRFYIPPNLRRHLNARIMEESLGEAKLPNLEKCQRCNFAMVVECSPDEMRVFSCQKCRAQHCRKCERPWTSLHVGRRCEDLLTEKEQKRRVLENKLSEAIIRKCQRCSVPFVKLEGCNKMTCRCGASQCYVCREPIRNYAHFCQHFRKPGQNKCGNCKKTCLLWESEEVADAKALAHVMAEAGKEGAELMDQGQQASTSGTGGR